MKEVLLEQASILDAEKIHELMEAVYESLDNKSLFVCDDLEYVKKTISDEGFAVKACNLEGTIVGCFIFRYPGIHEDNLGNDIKLELNELSKVVHMESAVVSPEYRGLGLQSKMLLYAEDIIDKSKYKYFMATVSPDNPASYKNLEKNGYQLMITKEKYGGLVRRIYMKTT